MTKTALITGASSGIGKAIALRLASESYNLIITGRRKEKLDLLASDIKKQYNIEVKCLNFDIRNKLEVDKSIDSLGEQAKKIDLLVNNAGLAVGISEIQEGIVDDWERMIDTNIKGILYITRKISPLMVEKSSGHIINISSIAAKEVYPGGNVYCASKHAVDALTKGMRIDLLKHNIKVSSIAPGMVETEFSLVRFKGDSERAASVYNGFKPLLAEDIADALVYIVSRPKHVNINDMLIMPTAQASARDIHKE